MDEKLTIFIAVTSAAVVLQMLILAGMFFTLRKLAVGVQAATDEVKTHAMPLLENGKHLQAQLQKLLDTSSPKIELVLDRARLQIIRADEMVTRAMDQVEETTEKVAHTVTSPVKHASGIVQGISTGFGTYFGQKRPRRPGPSDEMFI
jgi:predicted RND superfamily exporter protein